MSECSVCQAWRPTGRLKIQGPDSQKGYFKFYLKIIYFFLKYIVTLFYKKLRTKIVVCLIRESGPRHYRQ